MSNTNNKDEGIFLRDMYPLDCPYCGHGQSAAPSLFMKTGMMNQGAGNCVKCHGHMSLEIDLETNDRMIATKFSEGDTDSKK